MAKARRPDSRYRPHPLLGREAAARKAVEAHTGRTWSRWVTLARKQGPREEKALAAWLRAEHDLPARGAQWLAYEATHEDVPDYGAPGPLVDGLYAGRYQKWRALHEAVLDVAEAQGPDVVVTACQTMVPVYRKHVFAQLRPVEGGVQVQLALGEVAASGRLEPAAGRQPGDRLGHQVLVARAADVDARLEGWLRRAYEGGAGPIRRSNAFVVPRGFARALEGSHAARATWASMTPAMQRDMLAWVTSAKQEATRTRRQETALARLSQGRKRVY